MHLRILWATLLVTFATACGGDEGNDALTVAWAFESGDCGSNSIETVRVTWGASGGSTEEVEFPCSDAMGTIGDVDGGGSYSILAEGLDGEGVVRAASFGQTVSFGGGGGTGGIPIDITLHPKGADVIVSWSIASGGVCPRGVTLPYFITLYRPPAGAGGELTDEVESTQETCASGEATLTDVAPGDYIVEVDSRAVTPALRATAPVSVVAGENATVDVELLVSGLVAAHGPRRRSGPCSLGAGQVQ